MIALQFQLTQARCTKLSFLGILSRYQLKYALYITCMPVIRTCEETSWMQINWYSSSFTFNPSQTRRLYPLESIACGIQQFCSCRTFLMGLLLFNLNHVWLCCGKCTLFKEFAVYAPLSAKVIYCSWNSIFWMLKLVLVIIAHQGLILRSYTFSLCSTNLINLCPLVVT